MNKITGSKVAANGVNLVVEINDDVVQSTASKLAVALVMRNDSVSNIISVQECEECFCYALKQILAQDTGAKPCYDLVPQFFADITMSINSVYRGVRIRVSPISRSERPNSYERFLDVLVSVDIPVGKPLKVSETETSNVMKIGVVQLNGCDTLVGVESEVSIEELVVRSMLAVPAEEQEKIDRIVGHMDQMYFSRDELVRQWACSLPVGKRK